MSKSIRILILTFGILAGYTVASHADSGSAVALDAGVAATGSAVAAPPTLPDPTVDPGAALSTARSDLATYGYVWGGAAILLGLLAAFKKGNDASHWISNQYAVAALTAIPTIITALLLWKFGGGSTGGMLGTVVAALALLYPTGAKAAA